MTNIGLPVALTLILGIVYKSGDTPNPISFCENDSEETCSQAEMGTASVGEAAYKNIHSNIGEEPNAKIKQGELNPKESKCGKL